MPSPMVVWSTVAFRAIAALDQASGPVLPRASASNLLPQKQPLVARQQDVRPLAWPAAQPPQDIVVLFYSLVL